MPAASVMMPSVSYRRMLYGASSLLSVMIVIALILLGYGEFLEFRDRQISDFVSQKEDIKTEVDRLSARVTQFSEMFTRLQKAYGTFHFPIDLGRIKPGVVTSIDSGELSPMPLSFVVDGGVLQNSLPLERLFLMLGQASALPMFHYKEGLILEGFLYTSDHRFLVTYPSMDKAEEDLVAAMGVRRYIDIRSKTADKAMDDMAIVRSDGRGNRFAWFSLPGHEEGPGDAIARFAVRIYLAPDYFATIIFRVRQAQFQKFFLRNGNGGRLFVTNNAPFPAFLMRPVDRADGSLDGEIRAVIKQYNEQPGKNYFYQGGKLFLIDYVNGPDWNIVYAFSWQEIVQYISSDVAVGAIGCLFMLIFIWGATWYFDKFVFQPSHKNVMELAESRQFSQSIIETLPVGIVVYDPHAGHDVLRNAMAARMMASSNLSASDLHAHFAGCPSAAEQEAVGQDTESVMVAEIVLAGGGATYLGLVCSRTRFSGRDVLLFGMVDMNVQKEHEALLLEAKSAADRANQAKSMFLAELSHEIRTPLHGAIGHLELLSQEALEVSQRRRVDLIQTACARLMELVNDVLDVTKIESNELRIAKTSLYVNDLLESVAQLFAPLAAGKKLGFHCLFSPALEIPLNGDGHRLMQILQNLVGNAIKFTETGMVTLSAQLQRREHGVAWVRLEVKDTGIGISPEAQQRLFEPLEQADDSISRRFGGTGLGLFLCDQLAQLMGGKIYFSSMPGQGSTFGLDIPMEIIAGNDQGMQARPLAGRVVDIRCDLQQYAGMLRDFFEMWGATVWNGEVEPQPDVCLLLSDVGCKERVNDFGRLGVRTVILSTQAVGKTEEVDGVIHVSLYARNAWRDALLAGNEAVGKKVKEKPVLSGEIARSMDILVAEDDLVNFLLIKHQLETLGCTTVRMAKDGQEALTRWMAQPANILITDLGMPGLDGIELARKVMRLQPDAIVVAATAAHALSPAESDLFFDILKKPVLLKDLQRVIEKAALERRHAQVMMPAQEPQAAVVPEKVTRMLAAAFVETWPAQETQLTNALESASADDAWRVLHRIQGGLMVLGERELARQSLDLQNAFRVSLASTFSAEKKRCLQWLKCINELVERLESGAAR